MKIVIFGAGSIGCYVGGKLLAQGEDITFIGRERFKKAIDEHGLTLTHYSHPPARIFNTSIRYDVNHSCLADAELIILTVKSQATEESLRQIMQNTNKECLITSLQNGVRNERTLKDIARDFPTAGGMVPFNVVNKGNGHFHCGTEGELIFEKTYATGILAEKFNKAGIAAKTTENIQGVLWGKLLMNLNNALNVLSDQPLKQQLANRDYRRILALCIDESLSVLKTANIKPAQVGKVPPKHISKILRLPNAVFEFIAKGMLQIDPEARSSMWEDLNNGRDTEIDYLNGEIVALGDKFNHVTPINSKITALVKTAFKKKVSPALSGEQLLSLIAAK